MANPTGPWDSSTALTWLRWEGNSGRRDYQGMCAGLVADASGFSDSNKNANQWAWTIPQAIRHRGNGPAGTIQCYEGGTYGHIGYNLGGGVLLCNTESGAVGKMYSSYYSRIGPTWWVNPSKNKHEIFKYCTGSNNDKFEIPAPAVKKPSVSLSRMIAVAKTNGRAPGVATVRHALSGKGSGTTFGPVMRSKYKAYQQSLGYKGKDADGIPGAVSLAKLGKAHGFRVNP